MNRPRRGRTLADRSSVAAFPNDPREASTMRAFVSDFLRSGKVSEDVVDEVLVAVGEVVANACRHGRDRTNPGDVQIDCRIDGSHISIEVVDCGPGFDVHLILRTDMPDLLSPGGRGFFLMRQLMDDVSVDSSQGGTSVLLRRKLLR